MMIHEPVMDNFAPAPHRNLPNRILRAIDNALHLDGLPRNIRSTLADIARFVSQSKPFDTVFAHKTKIAERTGTSERTVYRHLQALQIAGLIEVLDQERKSRNGRFSVSRIRLTSRAAGLLGFIAIEENLFVPDVIDTTISLAIQENSSDDSSMGVDSEASQERSTLAKKEVIHSTPSAILSPGHTLSVPTFSKNQPHQRTENGLPIDLGWLTGNGVSRAGIFKLMGLAKNNKKRLSDVVLVVKDYLADMRGGRLYAYLAALCKGPTDFACGAAQERKRIDDERNALAYKRKCKIFRERFKGLALTDRSQSKLYVIDERAEFVQVIGKTRLGSAPLNDLSTWITGIESGKLVLATREVENRFQMI